MGTILGLGCGLAIASTKEEVKKNQQRKNQLEQHSAQLNKSRSQKV